MIEMLQLTVCAVAYYALLFLSKTNDGVTHRARLLACCLPWVAGLLCAHEGRRPAAGH